MEAIIYSDESTVNMLLPVPIRDHSLLRRVFLTWLLEDIFEQVSQLQGLEAVSWGED